jgi:hypothetical protein
MSHLLEFYGEECPHCEKMKELTMRLEKEKGLTVDRLEVWHNEENIKRMEELDKEPCGGVPFFVNTKTGKTICGEVEYDELEKWAE